LIFDIVGKKITKFYDLSLVSINRRHRFVIVTTEQTLNSVLDNFDYYKDKGLFDKRFWFKIIVPKSYSITFLDKLYEFYKRLKIVNGSYID
jgi:hypothetical protein